LVTVVVGTFSPLPTSPPPLVDPGCTVPGRVRHFLVTFPGGSFVAPPSYLNLRLQCLVPVARAREVCIYLAVSRWQVDFAPFL